MRLARNEQFLREETLIRCWNTTPELLQLTFLDELTGCRGVRANMTLGYIVGLLAALLTSLSYIPQIAKLGLVWQPRTFHDTC